MTNQKRVDEIMRRTGARITAARRQVFDVLLRAARPLTHDEIEQRTNTVRHLDRVTVYRALDWLVKQRLAHKVAGDDRTWRYNAVAAEHAADHAHFNCNRCGHVFCLEEVTTAYAIHLPPGYRAEHMDLTIRGVCERCA